MLVRCLSNRDTYTVESPAAAMGELVDRVLNITVSRDYLVYALGFSGEGVWAYIADDAYVDGPRRYPLRLFELLDPRVSKYWVLTIGRVDGEEANILAPPEWNEHPWFFNRVVDGEGSAVATFMRIKQKLDVEAHGDSDVGPDSCAAFSSTESATAIDRGR